MGIYLPQYIKVARATAHTPWYNNGYLIVSTVSFIKYLVYELYDYISSGVL